MIQHLEARRFHVPSDEPGRDPYLVDLDEMKGNGWCGCWDFEFRHMPRLVRGAKPGTEKCKHIERAEAHEQRILVGADS